MVPYLLVEVVEVLPLLDEPATTAPITAATPTPAATIVAVEPAATDEAVVLEPAATPVSSARAVEAPNRAVASAAAWNAVFIWNLR